MPLASKKKIISIVANTAAGEVGVVPLEHKKIARLAYSYWEARGRPEGSSEEDWFRAEAELRRRKDAYTASRNRRRHDAVGRTGSRRRQAVAAE